MRPQEIAGSAGASQPFHLIGGRTRARTLDPLIKSQLLYQLSYAPEASSFVPSPIGRGPARVNVAARMPFSTCARSGLLRIHYVRRAFIFL
jgi:hypothetical protein